jgi:hypothetical protein
MFRAGFSVTGSMNQKNRRGDARGGLLRAYRINVEAALLGSEFEGLTDRIAREEERRPLTANRPKVRERFGCHDCGHAWIIRGFLKGDGGSERGADQHDWAGRDGVQDSMQILLLEKAVRAHVSL